MMSIDFNLHEFWAAYKDKKEKYGLLDGWCEDYSTTMDKIAQELYDAFGIWI